MQEYWFFVVTDAEEHTLIYCTCEFMGTYAPLLNRMAEEEWGQSWMRHTTFTRKDYKTELHGHLGLDPKTLPVFRQRFEPEEGLRKLNFLREKLLKNEAAFIRNELVRPQDYEFLITDLNTAIGVMEKATELGEKWFLDVDLDK
ncbi:MAG: hypothetical protein IPN95_09135 [Bacteroidetes bacterium]|nr:hypothetical protein [Bacteroidota bacterium]MBL0016699.1 hypothetical protein [Bacteroidota bacterium]MBP6641260.1 hypothetical protein [Bacteroidia bacterium]MBP6721522.1 hypothetical protein [Bacteroidia bacterium]